MHIQTHNDQKLVTYIEQYFSSMAKPQINTPEVFAWFTGINMPVFNSVAHFYYTQNIATHIEEILKLAPKDKPCTFWIDALQTNALTLKEELEKREFKKIVTCPFMEWDVTSIEKPSGIIRKTTPENFDTFISILGTVFGLDEKTAHDFGALHAHSTSEDYSIYAIDKAVGAGTLFVSGNVGLILNIAVLPKYQKKGLGSAISQFLMHRAHELKLEKVVLNANPAAINMYQKLGFTIAYDLDIYAR